MCHNKPWRPKHSIREARGRPLRKPGLKSEWSERVNHERVWSVKRHRVQMLPSGEARLSCSRKTEWQGIGDKESRDRWTLGDKQGPDGVELCFPREITSFGLRQWEAGRDFWTESDMIWLWIFQGSLRFWCSESRQSGPRKKEKGLGGSYCQLQNPARLTTLEYSIRNGKKRKRNGFKLHFRIEPAGFPDRLDMAGRWKQKKLFTS